MNNVCPNCGITGPNFSCPNHTYCWGTGNTQSPTIQPQVTWMPVSDQLNNSSLFAEIGRLNVLLNERNKEIERLKGLMPPDERGPGFVGQGSWSVFAEKVVAERDALREVLAGLREKGVIDQHNRPLPLEGHHKYCGHGKDGWSMCTCDELKNVDEERANKQFQLLVKVGQNLIDKQTAGMRGPSQCSKCGDTGLVQVAPNARGVKQCDCKKYGSHHPECGRAKPGMRSPCNCLGLYERDARNQRDLDRCFDELVEKKTCEHGNTVCKRCGVGQPAIKTPEGKPLLPLAEFSAMRIEDNKERGITECNFQRQTGRTTAMVLKALEFVKENAMGAVVIEVDGNRMKTRVRALLKHYADETGVNHRQLARVFVKAPKEHISGIDVGLQLRDNVIDDMRERKPARDPRQDLKVGEHVRFEVEGIIKERQSAGIFQDEDGSDFEPIQYSIKDSMNGMTYYVGYHKIIKVIGKEEE